MEPANGGQGGAVTLKNAVSGSTRQGVLTFEQFAFGGPGTPESIDSGTGAAGAGGAASSMLTYRDKTSAEVIAEVRAVGGAGAVGPAGDGDGGDAKATIVLTASGSGLTEASATAEGGAPGGAIAHNGSATASSKATGHGSMTEPVATAVTAIGEAANAAATAGNSGKGAAQAEATARGSTGSGVATAKATKGPITVTASSTQTADIAAKIGAESEATPNRAVAAAFNSDSASSFAFGSAGVVFGDLPTKLRPVFTSKSTTKLGSAALGADEPSGDTGSHTYDTEVGWTINAAKLKTDAVLDIGLVNALVVGPSPASVELTVTENGREVLSISSPGKSFFTDRLRSLGVWKKSGPTLNVQVSMQITLDAPATGFGVDVVAGLAQPHKTPRPAIHADCSEIAGALGARRDCSGTSVEPNLGISSALAPTDAQWLAGDLSQDQDGGSNSISTWLRPPDDAPSAAVFSPISPGFEYHSSPL